MPEILFILALIFIIPSIFYLFHLPLVYMDEVILVVVFIIAIPILRSLFTAPFVPSQKDRIITMLKLAGTLKNKKVWEVGCGDGRIIRNIAKHGVKEAKGFEISIPLVIYGKIVSFLRTSSAKIYMKDMWKQDYSDVDILLCYLLPISMKRVEKEIWPQLKKGSQIVSNAFAMKGIKEDRRENGVYLYIKK